MFPVSDTIAAFRVTEFRALAVVPTITDSSTASASNGSTLQVFTIVLLPLGEF